MKNKYIKNASELTIITCGPLEVNQRLIAIIVSQLIFPMDHASSRYDIGWVSHCCLEKYRSACPYWHWTTIGLRRSKERSNLKRRSKSQSGTGRDSDFFADLFLRTQSILWWDTFDASKRWPGWNPLMNMRNTVIKTPVHLISPILAAGHIYNWPKRLLIRLYIEISQY